jgi:TRAP-type C4-dicarboxylate transport system permease small subunit
MDRIHSLLYGISRLSVRIFGAGYLLVALATTLDVALRNLFSMSIPGVYEVAGYVFAFATTWGFCFVLFERAHVRIDVAYQHFGARLRAIADVLALLSMGLFVTVLSYRAWLTLDDTLLFQASARTTLQTPLWIPQSIWLAGLLFFLLCIAFLILYTTTLLIRGRLGDVSSVAGIPHSVPQSTDPVP